MEAILPSVPCIECLIYSHLTSSPFSKLGEPFLASDSDFLFEYLSSRIYVKLKNIDDSIKFYINGRSLRYEVFKNSSGVSYDWIPSSGEYKTLNFLSECYKSAKNLAKYYFRYLKGGIKQYFNKYSRLAKVRVKRNDSKSNHGPWNYKFLPRVECFKSVYVPHGGRCWRSNQRGYTKGQAKVYDSQNVNYKYFERVLV